MKIKLLCAVLALIFIASGSAKLAGLEFELQAFERWGYPLGFMYFIGVIEVLGGVALLLPRLSALAGGCLALMMIGAVATHIIHAEWPMFVAASLILIFSALRAWLGRSEICELIGRRAP